MVLINKVNSFTRSFSISFSVRVARATVYSPNMHEHIKHNNSSYVYIVLYILAQGVCRAQHSSSHEVPPPTQCIFIRRKTLWLSVDELPPRLGGLSPSTGDFSKPPCLGTSPRPHFFVTAITWIRRLARGPVWRCEGKGRKSMSRDRGEFNVAVTFDLWLCAWADWNSKGSCSLGANCDRETWEYSQEHFMTCWVCFPYFYIGKWRSCIIFKASFHLSFLVPSSLSHVCFLTPIQAWLFLVIHKLSCLAPFIWLLQRCHIFHHSRRRQYKRHFWGQSRRKRHARYIIGGKG